MNIFFGSLDKRWNSRNDRLAWGMSSLFFAGIAVLDAYTSLRALGKTDERLSDTQWEEYVDSLIMIIPAVSEVLDSIHIYMGVAFIAFACIFRFVSNSSWSFSAWGKVVRCGLIFLTVGSTFQFCLLIDGFDWQLFVVIWVVLMIMYYRKKGDKHGN